MHKSSEFSRLDRINKAIAKHLAVILQQHMTDPRFTFINITHVKASPDLSEAKVYFTSLVDRKMEEEQALCKALNNAQKHLRYVLAQELDLRRTPRLSFYYDTKLLEAMRIEELLKCQNINED
jgi:ribosome-binding factor A